MADLDHRQRAAVDSGPIDSFIAAGAGSGKTRVLTTRFVNAVAGVPPYRRTEVDRVLAVTFTDKAAGELAERVRGSLIAVGEEPAARSIGDAWISTIHGMCSRILRRHALEVGIDPGFSVIDDVQAGALEAAALEDTLAESLDLEGFSRLLESYGLETTASAARGLRGSVRALGLRVRDIATIPKAQVAEASRAAAHELGLLAKDFTPMRTTKTVRDNAAAVAALAAALQAGAPQEPERIGQLLLAAESCKLRRLSSVEGHDELVLACREHIETVKRCMAQLLVSGFEEEFISFAESFEERYAFLKHRRVTLDFEDLQLKTAELLEQNAAVAARYRAHFEMVMLDESQDTNPLQLRIIAALSRNNLCTVGDENQSIYAFRHADIEVFRAREASVTCRAPLDINYRTAPSLLAGINGLFVQPTLLGDRFMRLSPPPVAGGLDDEAEPRFQVRFLNTAEAPTGHAHAVDAEHIAVRVQELLRAGAEPGQIAVLMRALAGGRAARVEAALLRRGIPVYITSGGSFFDRPEVAEARALLETIVNVRDDAAFSVVLAGRLTALCPDALIAVREHANAIARERACRAWEVHLWDSATDSRLMLDPVDARALSRTIAAIERARALRGTRPLADTVLEPMLELDADLVAFASGHEGARAWGNVLKLMRMAAEHEAATGGNLGTFLEYLALREMHATSEQEATLDGEGDAVRVMSIHAAKGLEFPHVIVSGLTGSQGAGPIAFGRRGGRLTLGMKLPGEEGYLDTLGSALVCASSQRAADAEAIRLLYVACTRAEETLTIIGRTNAEKVAGSSLGDLVRSGLGFAEAGSIVEGDQVLGTARARISLRDAVPPEEGIFRWVGAANQTQAPDHEPPPEKLEALPAAQVPARVSYTGLSTYQRCPYRYYLTSIAHLPAPPSAREGGALALGSAVHAVLERLRSAGEPVDTLLNAASASAGLEESAKGQLRQAVEAYVQSDIAKEVFAAEDVLREASITVPVGGTVLVGAIDVLARAADETLIVDYKTGAAPLSAADALERYRLQAECYSLAALKAGANRVRVVFAEVERGRQTEYRYSAEETQALESHVTDIVSSMAEGRFEPRDGYDPDLCETCPGLGGLCPVMRPTFGGAA